MIANLDSAMELDKLGSFQQAGKALLSSMNGIEDILRSESVSTPKLLFDIINEAQNGGRIEMIMMVVKYFSGMAEPILLRMHPLSQALALLSTLEPSELQDINIVCYKNVTNELEDISGPVNSATLEYKVGFIRHRYESQEGDVAEFELRRLLKRLESLRDYNRLKVERLRFCLAYHLYNKKDYHGALKVIHDYYSGAASGGQCKHDLLFSHWIDALRLLAHCQDHLQYSGSGEANLREAIALRTSWYGAQDGYTTALYIDLENRLVKGGKPDAAALVRKERERILKAINALE